jgi:hypothetical protein
VRPEVVHHRTPLALWGFATIWCGGVVLGTLMLWRDGLPDGATPLGAWIALFVFWMAAIALAAFAFSQPTVTLRVWPDGRAEILRRWPLKRRRLSLRSDELALRVVEEVDSDGDPYFRLRLSAGHHLDMPVSVAEGRREHCETVRGRLQAAGVRDAAP